MAMGRNESQRQESQQRATEALEGLQRRLESAEASLRESKDLVTTQDGELLQLRAKVKALVSAQTTAEDEAERLRETTAEVRSFLRCGVLCCSLFSGAALLVQLLQLVQLV